MIAREETVKQGNAYSTCQGNAVNISGEHNGRGIDHIFISDNVDRVNNYSTEVEWDIFSEQVAPNLVVV